MLSNNALEADPEASRATSGRGMGIGPTAQLGRQAGSAVPNAEVTDLRNGNSIRTEMKAVGSGLWRWWAER